MNPTERLLIHISNLAVVSTGLVYGFMLYFMKSDDPFSIVNHPYQPHMQHLHVLTAPLFIFAVGLIWRRHIWGHWQRRIPQGRDSGSSLLFLLVPMILSGYLLQTAVDPTWRDIWKYLHIGTSCIWTLAFVLHFFSARKLMSKKAGSTMDTTGATPSFDGQGIAKIQVG